MLNREAQGAERMTVEEVAERLKIISDYARRHDHESAHAIEDDLYRDVLRAISHGAENAADLARSALATQEMTFERWCA